MGIMSNKKPTVEQCKLLEDTYKRYKSGTMNKIEQLRLGSINSESLLHSIFGMTKFGSEYFANCDVKNYEKSIILGGIVENTLKYK